MAKVIVYGTPTCSWCDRVKDFLKEHKVNFAYKDVSKDRSAAEEMIEKTGQMGVPVIEIDGKTIVGFDRAAISDALKIRG